MFESLCVRSIFIFFLFKKYQAFHMMIIPILTKKTTKVVLKLLLHVIIINIALSRHLSLMRTKLFQHSFIFAANKGVLKNERFFYITWFVVTKFLQTMQNQNILSFIIAIV